MHIVLSVDTSLTFCVSVSFLVSPSNKAHLLASPDWQPCLSPSAWLRSAGKAWATSSDTQCASIPGPTDDDSVYGWLQRVRIPSCRLILRMSDSLRPLLLPSLFSWWLFPGLLGTLSLSLPLCHVAFTSLGMLLFVWLNSRGSRHSITSVLAASSSYTLTSSSLSLTLFLVM